MVNDKYYLDLVMGDPINYNGLIFYPPLFVDIKKIGVDNYNKIMQIYTLTLECFENLPKGEDTNIFEDLFLQDESLLYCLSESLYILTKPDSIILNSNSKNLEIKFIDHNLDKAHSIIYNWCKNKIPRYFKKIIKIKDKEITYDANRSFIIDSSNFDDITNIILKINANKKVKIEKPPENMSQRQRDVWEKLQEGRNRETNKNNVHIYDILNVCEFGGDYHIPIETIMNWSLWRIMNCYKSRTGWKNYDDSLQIALLSGDSKNISGSNHWHQQLMIRE